MEKGEEREMEGNRRTEAVRALRRLARGRANDAVKLAYLTEERLEEIDRMDLSALTEFKRHGNGAVEVKFIDRAAILERLLELADSLLRQVPAWGLRCGMSDEGARLACRTLFPA